jgi:hypothetical protein
MKAFERVGQAFVLGAVLLVGSRAMQRQQVSQGHDRQMDFAAFAPFGSVVTGTFATFRAGKNYVTIIGANAKVVR